MGGRHSARNSTATRRLKAMAAEDTAETVAEGRKQDPRAALGPGPSGDNSRLPAGSRGAGRCSTTCRTSGAALGSKRRPGAHNHTWTASYDPVGNVASSTDPLGRVYANTYDAANHLISTTDPAGGVTQYTYDAAGRRTSATYPDSTTATYSYDGDNRLTARNDSAGTFSETYDDAGRVL